MSNKFLLILISFFLIILMNTSASAQDLSDIIQPIKVLPGESDTILISDVFYADKYDLSFSKSKRIDIQYYRQEQKLVLNTPKGFKGMTLIDFALNGKTYSIPILSKNSGANLVKKKFLYRSNKKALKVSLVGSFNGWNAERNPMIDRNNTGIYECELMLEPGSYVYKFSVDGDLILDAENPERAPTGFETFNSVLRVIDPETANFYLHIKSFAKNNNLRIYSFALENGVKGESISKHNIIALLDNNKIDDKYISFKNNEIMIQVPISALTGEKTIRVVISGRDHISNMQTLFLLDGGAVQSHTEKFSWYDASVYSIMVDRFNDGDRGNSIPVVHDSLFPQANYAGGDLQGIINKIEDGYFNDLGISVLWLSPVYDNPNTAFREYPKPYRWYSGYHGYWPISETAVEEKFGTMDKMKELVAKAHKNNIKVLLDIVAHHVHIDNPLYQEHPDWFGTLELPDGRKNLRLWDEYRLTTWFEPYMPSFDYTRSHEPIDYMSQNCLWWLTETGADGFRHDAVKHVPNEFWRNLTRLVKSKIEIPEHRKVYQIGETFGDYDLIGSYVNNGQLSAQFNFNLSYLAIPVFLKSSESFQTLDYHMKKTFSAYGVNHLMGNIMDSHDKIRFMAYADGDIAEQGVDTREIAWHNPPTVDHSDSYLKAELYYAYMFTVPGLPFIYYGSEFGMTGADDPDNRRMMRFGDQLNVNEKSMLSVTSKIVKMRNEHSALRYGDFYTLRADTAIYSYIRTDMNERLIVILNKDLQTQNVELSLPKCLGVTELVDINNDEKIIVKKFRLNALVPGLGWRVLKVLK